MYTKLYATRCSAIVHNNYNVILKLNTMNKGIKTLIYCISFFALQNALFPLNTTLKITVANATHSVAVYSSMTSYNVTIADVSLLIQEQDNKFKKKRIPAT